jgi:hypothetical protein
MTITTTTTTNKPAVLGIHVAGVAVMVACFVLGLYVSAKLHTEIGAIIIGAGFFVYGKLGFKPAAPILDRILASLAEHEPERVARLASKRPAANPSDQ